jgi:hypothetical protein
MSADFGDEVWLAGAQAESHSASPAQAKRDMPYFNRVCMKVILVL